jgi:hypothetical protein
MPTSTTAKTALAGDDPKANPATGKSRQLTSAKAAIAGLAWTPDSKSIVFSSNRAGLASLWRIPVLAGIGGENASLPALPVRALGLRSCSHVETNIWRVAGPAAKRSGPATPLIVSSREESDQAFRLMERK